jgi:hypothetical protein
MSKIKITERRIVTWDCAKCPANIGSVETLNNSDVQTKNVKVFCSDCDTAYCLHWGSNGFETWVEEWETYTQRHTKRDEMRSKGKQSFE